MSTFGKAWYVTKAAGEAMVLQLRIFEDGILDMREPLAETDYVGPCVCDVCPCPLVELNHRSGAKHCWPCTRGRHWERL